MPYIRSVDSLLGRAGDIGQVGAGGDGSVHLYRVPGRTYAVKFYRRGKTSYMAECEILVALKRAHDQRLLPVVEIIAADDPDEPSRSLLGRRIVLEYCQMGDLWKFKECYVRNRERVPESIIWSIYRNLVEALAFLHTGYGSRHHSINWRPIIHRDIKPGNILIRRTNDSSSFPFQAILADFGRATYNDVAPQFFSMNTPDYAPPEHPVSGLPADVWALGGSIHFLALSKAPVADEYDFHRPRDLDDEGYRRIPRKAYSLTPEYSQHLDSAVHRSLRWNPIDRWSAAQLLNMNWPEVTRGHERRDPGRHEGARRVELRDPRGYGPEHPGLYYYYDEDLEPYYRMYM